MTVHLVNPSDLSFGVGIITPRWLFVLAAATPARHGTPRLTDETLARLDERTVEPGDVVGIGIHTSNALRGYAIGTWARARGATVVFGGIHATLFPDEAHGLGGAHAVVKGDGDRVWAAVLDDCADGRLAPVYDGGRVDAEAFVAARWDLLPARSYMMGSVQTVRGCPKHCSFCSVWRTDGQRPRQRGADVVVREIVELRRRGYRFITLADDNFYPVTLDDLRMASRLVDKSRYHRLVEMREERFALLDRLAQLPPDMVFYTQITMEAAEDPAFLDAMRRARVRGALVGIEAVTPAGLKDVYKGFNDVGEALVARLRRFQEHGVHVLGSFIFGLPSDRPSTFDATMDVAERAGLAFAQFVMLTPFPGTIDFANWEKAVANAAPIAGVPVSRYWLIPHALRPKMYSPHPTMSADEIRARTQGVWDRFYDLGRVWRRSSCVQSLRGRLAFTLISKLYRQMYANTGIATDSARVSRANRWARWIAAPCRRLFTAAPMPGLQVPLASGRAASGRQKQAPERLLSLVRPDALRRHDDQPRQEDQWGAQDEDDRQRQHDQQGEHAVEETSGRAGSRASG